MIDDAKKPMISSAASCSARRNQALCSWPSLLQAPCPALCWPGAFPASHPLYVGTGHARERGRNTAALPATCSSPSAPFNDRLFGSLKTFCRRAKVRTSLDRARSARTCWRTRNLVGDAGRRDGRTSAQGAERRPFPLPRLSRHEEENRPEFTPTEALDSRS